MNTRQYLAALKKLGLTPHSKTTAEALGLKLRAIQDYASGNVEAIPGPVDRLLAMYLRHGLPKQYQP